MMLCFVIFGLTACNKGKNKSNIMGLNKESNPNSPYDKPKYLSRAQLRYLDNALAEFSVGVLAAMKQTFTGYENATVVQNDANGIIESVLSENLEKLEDQEFRRRLHEYSGLRKDLEEQEEPDLMAKNDSLLVESVKKITLDCIKENKQLEKEKFQEKFEQLFESLLSKTE